MFVRAYLIVLLLLPPLLAGCAQRAMVVEQPSLSNCCVDNETRPEWLIRVAEPVAPLVGRIIGHIAWRRGYLDDTNASALIMARLKPLDIVLISSKGRLSGNTIPGLFHHTGVYLGGESELRRLGIWNSPALRDHQDAIRSGARFIEADHEGVHLSTPERVFDTDRVVIIRPSIPVSNWRARSALRFFEQVGNSFDFRFDISTPDAQFCVELICDAIPELGLPRQLVYGRPTIIPDTLAAELFRGNHRLRFVAYVRGQADGFEFGSRDQLAEDLAVHWSPKRISRDGQVTTADTR
jgi:hypothetical protein